jgi:hypothetical protein
MVVVRASKAKVVPTFTVYGWDDSRKFPIFYGAFDGELAVRCGAPPEVLLIIDVGSGEQFLISASG